MLKWLDNGGWGIRDEMMELMDKKVAGVLLLADGEGRWRVVVGGEWQITSRRPRWREVVGGKRVVGALVVVAENLENWDGALLLFLTELRAWALRTGVSLDETGLPEAARELADQMGKAFREAKPRERGEGFLAQVGKAAQITWGVTRDIAAFVGECVIAAQHLVKNPGRLRWKDCLHEMQQCGAMALPIVGLISLLVGLIMAYQSAVLMRQFGADIYVADAVGLAMVREFGALMTAIILAGRTGAAFAATLGNMKANEEIDALQTLGIRPVEFLVIPRLLALGLMMPLLTLYSNALGILGGMVVSFGLLDIPPTAYWVATQGAIDLSDVSTGLIKASVFGVLVGLSGCHRGLQAERSAAGVGQAATSAVVMSLLLIIVFDAVFAVLFNIFGL